MTISSCNGSQSDEIVVIGKAENRKAGAVVVSKEKGGFYLEGVDYWDDRTLGKVVKVKGKLVTENKEPEDSTEPSKQQIVGIKRIILKPKWEVVK